MHNSFISLANNDISPTCYVRLTFRKCISLQMHKYVKYESHLLCGRSHVTIGPQCRVPSNSQDSGMTNALASVFLFHPKITKYF